MAKVSRAQSRPKVDEYLKLPYTRSVIPQSDGSFHAEILEFSGCVATGETPEAAYRALEEVAESWIEASIEVGRTIPAPLESQDYSGKTVVRMPRSLHRKAAIAAQRNDVSLNQFIVSSIGVAIGQSDERTGRTARVAQNATYMLVLPSSVRGIESQTSNRSLIPLVYEGINQDQLRHA